MAGSAPSRRWVLLFFLLFCGITSGLAHAQETGKLQEMEVLGVVVDPGGQARVLLRSKKDKRSLSMAIGQFEAVGIALPLEGVTPPRPYTHDLLLDVLRRFKASVTRVVITELRENTYYSTIVLQVDGREVQVDARPSDAVAIALRGGAPILAAEKVLEAQAQGARP